MTKPHDYSQISTGAISNIHRDCWSNVPHKYISFGELFPLIIPVLIPINQYIPIIIPHDFPINIP